MFSLPEHTIDTARRASSQQTYTCDAARSSEQGSVRENRDVALAMSIYIIGLVIIPHPLPVQPMLGNENLNANLEWERE